MYLIKFLFYPCSKKVFNDGDLIETKVNVTGAYCVPSSILGTLYTVREFHPNNNCLRKLLKSFFTDNKIRSKQC